MGKRWDAMNALKFDEHDYGVYNTVMKAMW